MSIRTSRINQSTLVKPIDVEGFLDNQSVENLKDTTTDLNTRIGKLEGTVRDLNGSFDTHISKLSDILRLPTLDIGVLERTLSPFIGDEIFGQGKAILNAIQGLSQTVINRVYGVISRASCLLSGLNLNALFFGLVGLFSLNTTYNGCDPLEGLRNILSATSRFLNLDLPQSVVDRLDIDVNSVSSQTSNFPASSSDDVNQLVGLGITQSAEVGMTSGLSTIIDLVDPLWASTYIPDLPNAILSGVSTSAAEGGLIKSTLFDQLDYLYGDWHTDAASSSGSLYNDMDEFYGTGTTLMPFDPCGNTGDLSSVQKLRLLSGMYQV